MVSKKKLLENYLKRMIRTEIKRLNESTYTLPELKKLVDDMAEGDNAKFYKDKYPSAKKAYDEGKTAEKTLIKIGFLDKNGLIKLEYTNDLFKQLDDYYTETYG